MGKCLSGAGSKCVDAYLLGNGVDELSVGRKCVQINEENSFRGRKGIILDLGEYVCVFPRKCSWNLHRGNGQLGGNGNACIIFAFQLGIGAPACFAVGNELALYAAQGNLGGAMGFNRPIQADALGLDYLDFSSSVGFG